MTTDLINALLNEFSDDELERISADLQPFMTRVTEDPMRVLAVAVGDAVYGTSDAERAAAR
jgi:hypothetical protein